RALEADGAGALPHDDRAVLVGQRDQRVVEGGLDVRLADGDVLASLTADPSAGSASPWCWGQLPLPLLADGLLRALAGAGVRARALTVDGQAAAVAEAAV